ncbi:MAG: hypothetical protein HFG50_13975 [Lachnospiraceae bacterium]|jgi:hypothetical protein|nr:hypothetical protein [Lachnospiraceae bacterium]
MNDLAQKLALIVCEQCRRHEGESEIEFSSRLLSVYNSCYDNIETLIEQEKQPALEQSVKDFLSGR